MRQKERAEIQRNKESWRKTDNDGETRYRQRYRETERRRDEMSRDGEMENWVTGRETVRHRDDDGVLSDRGVIELLHSRAPEFDNIKGVNPAMEHRFVPNV